MYYGHSNLDRVMGLLGEHLSLGWVAASVWDGVPNEVHHRQVFSRWKPILVYSKGQWGPRDWWMDVYRFEREGEGGPRLAAAPPGGGEAGERLQQARRPRGRSVRGRLHDGGGMQADGAAVHLVRHRRGGGDPGPGTAGCDTDRRFDCRLIAEGERRRHVRFGSGWTTLGPNPDKYKNGAGPTAGILASPHRTLRLITEPPSIRFALDRPSSSPTA